MTEKWSPEEILDIAVRVEKNGQKFYEALEKKSEDEKLQSTWRYLKEQETEHEKIFSEMLEKANNYLVFEYGSGEYEAFLKAIASEYIFTPELIKEKIQKTFNSDLEAVDFALNMEKESILVYSALEDYVIEDRRKILKKIIAEEQKHFITLTDLKKQLIKK